MTVHPLPFTLTCIGSDYMFLRVLMVPAVMALSMICSSCTYGAQADTKPIAPEPIYDEVVIPETSYFLIVDDTKLCYGEEDTDPLVCEAVNNTLLQVPRWIRQAFIKSGWEMKVVAYDIATEDYGDTHNAGAVRGSTSYKSKVVKIQNTMLAAASTPIHELGHWLDAYCGYVTFYDETFASIWEEEGEVYKNTFGPSCAWSAQEFFAEGFWCYWRSPSSLKEACPRFYCYLEQQLVVAETADKVGNKAS